MFKDKFSKIFGNTTLTWNLINELPGLKVYKYSVVITNHISNKNRIVNFQKEPTRITPVNILNNFFDKC